MIQGAQVRQAMTAVNVIRSAALALALIVSGIRGAEAAVVLIYHRFDDGRYPSTNLNLDTFRGQLQWLADNAFDVWPASRLVALLQTEEPIPDGVAVITIDDGYRSLLGAAALLEQFGYPFSVFVSTRPIDRGGTDLLDWEELRQLCIRGGEILNHGAEHESLLARPGESDESRRLRVRDQVATAQARIDAEVPADCRHRIFSYPYGEFDKLAEEMLAGEGYAAFGQQSGPVAAWNSRQALPRFPVNQASAASPLMQTKLMSLSFPAVLQPQDTVVGDNPPELRLEVFPGIERVHCFDGSGEPLERQAGVDHWLSQFWYVP